MTIDFRTYSDLGGADRSDLAGQVAAQRERVRRRLAEVRRVVAVMSGKGGVGKSLVASLLAAAASWAGARVGLLDADLAGPTAARLSGVRPRPIRIEGGAAVPPTSAAGVRVMSMELLLEEGRPLSWREPETEEFVWRGAQEHAALRELLADVAWGALDLLLVDLPPGGARAMDLAGLVPDLSGALAVTIPSAASRAAVERSLHAVRGRGVRILGVVENMAGVACPACGVAAPLFPGDAGEALAAAFGVPLLGRLPLDPDTSARVEAGEPEAGLEGPVGAALAGTVRFLLDLPEGGA